MALFCSRLELFAKVLGPPQQHWVGGSDNKRHAVWRVEADGLPIWILRSNRGAAYEMEHTGTPWDGTVTQADLDKALRFLARFYLQMEDIEPVQKYGEVVAEQDDPILARARAELDAAAVVDAPSA